MKIFLNHIYSADWNDYEYLPSSTNSKFAQLLHRKRNTHSVQLAQNNECKGDIDSFSDAFCDSFTRRERIYSRCESSIARQARTGTSVD